MKIYLAARYSRFREMLDYARDLKAAGHIVTSRWINGNHQISDDGLSAQAAEAERVRFACEDRADLEAADCVISFTESPRSTNSRGGRHVEHGIALALGKRVIVIGHRENVFHCLPGIEFFETWSEARQAFLIIEP
jgi:nucleoside 2-deoxyribosyltransferase